LAFDVFHHQKVKIADLIRIVHGNDMRVWTQTSSRSHLLAEAPDSLGIIHKIGIDHFKGDLTLHVAMFG
jgi:hypothetical protein